MRKKDLNFKSYITVEVASKLLGVSKGTVRRWEASGKIRSLRHPINGYRLFSESDLREVLWKLKIEQKL